MASLLLLEITTRHIFVYNLSKFNQLFMNSKVLLSVLIIAAFAFIISCNSSSDYNTKESNDTAAYIPPPKTDTASGNSDAKMANSTPATTNNDEETGVGKFQHVELTYPLDKKMVDEGKNIYDSKCASCHKLTDEKLVGPGWKDVTDRRTPEWIMNFLTNTEEMLEKNAQAKNLYEICLVKMPDQNLSDDDARAVLEFQRNNDRKK